MNYLLMQKGPFSVHCSLADFQAKKGLRLVLVTGIVERNSDNGRYVKILRQSP